MKRFEDLSLNTPFIVAYEDLEWEIIRLSNTLHVEQSLFGKTDFYLERDSNPLCRSINENVFIIVDWFEENPPHKCNCDFYSVILVSGCKCGGL